MCIIIYDNNINYDKVLHYSSTMKMSLNYLHLGAFSANVYIHDIILNSF